MQIIAQWVAGSWAGNSKCPTPIQAETVSRHNEVMTPYTTWMKTIQQYVKSNNLSQWLYYENATRRLRNATKTQKNKLYESARKSYRETHGITVRKRTIPASVYTCRPKWRKRNCHLQTV